MNKFTFKDKWTFALNGTFETFHCLFGDVGSFNRVLKDLYYEKARQIKPVRKLRSFIKKFSRGKMKLSEAEDKFWNHPLAERLFEIWLENISGVRRSWLDSMFKVDLTKPTNREKIEFVQYMFNKLEIMYDPKHADLYENYKDLAFSLTMLRPQNQAHIYISFSFMMRPLKEYIRQYFNIAVITGQYDVLLKRYPPYHIMPNMHVTHGERTMLDSRGLDFRPITYKLDLKFHVPIEFRAQTRKKGCFVICPGVNDGNAEKLKQAQISKIQNDLKNNFPHYGHITNVDIGDDGKVYSMFGEPKEIPFYGQRRARYLAGEDEMNLLKPIPTPSPASGLIVRFHLRDPVAVLMEGIYGERDVTLKEIEYLLKCLDLLGPESRKGVKERKDSVGIVIDKAFETDRPAGVKDGTINFIERLRQLQNESEEKVWKYLTDYLIAGKNKPLLQTLCRGLMTQVFDIIFSLWPLITGNELTMGDSGDIEFKGPPKKVVLMPLLNNLKAHLQGPLNAIFSKHIDVSAATKRTRSEPRLAAMILKYALALKPNEDVFRKMLHDHLEEHYETHFNFLREYLAVNEKEATAINNAPPGFLEGMPEVVADTHRMKLHKDKQEEFTKDLIKHDINGIVAIANNTRQRLLSPGENNSLLRFIDPDSILVHMGPFEYEGDMLEKEEEFIFHEEAHQIELAELHCTKVRELKTLMSGGAQDEIMMLGQKRKMWRDAERVIAKAEQEARGAIAAAGHKASEYRALEMAKEDELSKVLAETKLGAITSLKEGNIREYAILALVRAHYYGGIGELERILEHSPNIVMAIDPHLHHEREFNEIREKLIEIIEHNKKEMDPLTMSILMEKDYKDIILTDVYKDFAEKVADILKNVRLNVMTQLPKGGMPGGGMYPGAYPPWGYPPWGYPHESGRRPSEDKDSSKEDEREEDSSAS